MLFIIFVLSVLTGMAAHLIICPVVTVSIPVEPIVVFVPAFEPTFTAYRDGDVCMMQFYDFEVAKAWASESGNYEIYSTVGTLVGTSAWKFDVAPTDEI